jgi:hypothetical protein
MDVAHTVRNLCVPTWCRVLLAPRLPPGAAGDSGRVLVSLGTMEGPPDRRGIDNDERRVVRTGEASTVAAGRGQSKVRPVKHCGYPTQIVKLENALFLLSFRYLAGRDSKGKSTDRCRVQVVGGIHAFAPLAVFPASSAAQMAGDLRYRSAIALPAWLDPLE